MENTSLDIVITRIAMATPSGDKELDIFSNALQAAIKALNGDQAGLASIAESVLVALGSDVDTEDYQDNEDLKELKRYLIN